MNVLEGFGLYLLGAFALITLSLFNILPTNYLGGLVIAGFIGGLFFFWLNSWRQGEKMLKAESLAVEVEKVVPSMPKEVEKYYPCEREPIPKSKSDEGQEKKEEPLVAV